MKRRIKAFLMALVMVFSVVAAALGDVTVYKADEDLIVKLHYEREDGDYTDWDVWFWELGGDGGGYEFVEEDGEMVATKVVTPGVTEMGYIVRKGGSAWAAKDVDKDQFIDLGTCLSGTVHMYVKSGVEGHEVVLGDDVVQGTKLVYANYDNENVQLAIKVTGEIEDKNTAFKIYDANKREVPIKLVVVSNYTYIVKLAEELDVTAAYTVTYNEKEYSVTMPDYYSTADFEAENTYTGNDLGATWSKDSTTFKVWAPVASDVKVNLYKGGDASKTDLIDQVQMTKDVNGTWVATVEGDLNGTYYTYSTINRGVETEACDPYAKTTGVNGKRAMVIDMDSTDPEGWDKDTNPHAGETINDAIIYELHIRDLGSDSSSGIDKVGKYLSLTEHGTKTSGGIATGIDHIKELGVTHIHILPMYDYGSVDESKLDTPQFNWGYDPVNYNVPEGSYSTDPYNGEVRVSEVKQMVQSLHKDGISVVMDVVYNHVYNASEYCFNKIVPDYFSRPGSSGSGCGNDTASERSMVKKYIVDSVNYWVEEYHIDGFRFDLVGLIDTETINEVVKTVHEKHPDVIFYGEGWTMSTIMTKDGYTLTTQQNSEHTPGFAFFSDTMRDTLKGGVFNIETGFVSGALGQETKLEQCFLGSADPWCSTPSQAVNYASCHDNYALFDVLQQARKDASFEDLVKMNNLAAAIYMTAQGIPFMQAGEEMLRTKVKEDGTFDHNSYSSPDSVNSLKWNTLEDEAYYDVFEYYKGLVAFRKAHPVLRLTTADDVAKYVRAVRGMASNVSAYSITGGPEGEKTDAMYIVFNANPDSVQITLPEGKWNVYIDGEDAGTEILRTVSGTVEVAGISAMVFVQEPITASMTANASPIMVPIIVCVVSVLAIAAVTAVAVVVKRKSMAK